MAEGNASRAAIGIELLDLKSIVASCGNAEDISHTAHSTAQSVARDFYNFAQSFAAELPVANGRREVVVPVRVLDMWFQGVEKKLKFDPAYFKKKL